VYRKSAQVHIKYQTAIYMYTASRVLIQCMFVAKRLVLRLRLLLGCYGFIS